MDLSYFEEELAAALAYASSEAERVSTSYTVSSKGCGSTSLKRIALHACAGNDQGLFSFFPRPSPTALILCVQILKGAPWLQTRPLHVLASSSINSGMMHTLPVRFEHTEVQDELARVRSHTEYRPVRRAAWE